MNSGKRRRVLPVGWAVPLQDVGRMTADCVRRIEQKRAEIRACYADFDVSMQLIRELDELTASLDKLQRYQASLKTIR